MKAPENFENFDAYACYDLIGCFALQEAIDLVSEAIAFARDQRIRKLLVDVTQATGFESPGTLERFYMAIQFAREARSIVIVAIVAREELIDPDKFGITVARNRGLLSDVFTSRADATAWLLDPHPQ